MTITIRVSDATLYAEALGTGPAAILLHAGGERRQVWRPVAGRLAAAGFRTVSLDQRGHGQSEGWRDEAFDPFTTDLQAVIDLVGGCPVVVGASLGGFASMLALGEDAYQERAAGLVLVDVVPDPDPERVRAFLTNLPVGGGDSPLVTEILRRAEDFRSAARRLRLPMMLVLAGRSAVSVEEVERLRRAVPQLRIATIEDAGHLVARDAPTPLSDVLTSFLWSDAVRDRRIDRFIQLAGGRALLHPGGTLSEHLHRVGDTLRRWDAQPHVVDAGRLHAAYGTQGFGVPAAHLATRDHLLGFVDASAERLISLYGRCDRQASYETWATRQPILVCRDDGTTTPLSDADRRALIAVTVANEMDVLEHDAGLRRSHGARLKRTLLAWRPWLAPAAQSELESWDID